MELMNSLTYVLGAFGLLLSIYSLILTLLLIKHKKRAIKLQRVYWEILFEEILSDMEVVEGLYNQIKQIDNSPMPELKKSEVMTKIKTYCTLHKIDVDEGILDEVVERLITFSKKVNYGSLTVRQEFPRTSQNF